MNPAFDCGFVHCFAAAKEAVTEAKHLILLHNTYDICDGHFLMTVRSDRDMKDLVSRCAAKHNNRSSSKPSVRTLQKAFTHT
ncbi:hypothetical protein PsYK624_088090 [Phanerochaete sordida]|uniref:Uncharacterized protein n=1 Tax=Phanerochaete sordida TaxID=48140 RepID=A0A9P3GE32_9APHY|nr:hypothetical protein PsYK624_088090 [Phanerochaete sordida]